MSIASLYLKSREDRRLNGGHLWIYSNEVDVKQTPLTALQPGQLVQVESYQGKALGIAYVNPHTLLCARLLTRDINQNIDEEFFINKLQRALLLREQLFAKPYYRLVFGESDGLPGLVVDRYDDIFVMQINTAGMEQLKELIISALQNIFKPKVILLRNNSSMRKMENLESYVKAAVGEVPELITLEENNAQFQASIKTGQKTGWFYDHRYNRAYLKNYVKNKRVLDIFSYVGAWGIQAAIAGAREVICIDSSADAIALLQQNAKLNKVDKLIHTIIGDAFVELKNLQAQEKFEVIVLDPPAFIKKRKDIKEGFIAYQRVNELAMKLLAPNGILITSSCSLHMPTELLIEATLRAANRLNRGLQILQIGHQAPDHPVHPAITETAYLKALFCRVI